MTKYHVRQYRPNYFSGFENDVFRDIEFVDILKCAFFDNFKHENFDYFKIEDHGEEKIIVAYYTNGEHWVAGFAVDSETEFAKNWRYNAR